MLLFILNEGAYIMVKKAENQWWKEFYDQTFGEIVLQRDNYADLDVTVTFIKKYLHIKAGDTIFDQCCGTGSVSHALARGGINAIGTDLIDGYIDTANKIAQSENLSAKFTAADAFNYVAPRACDGAINWYTSFGNADDDALNIEMIKRMYDSLKSGGYMAIDYFNTALKLRTAIDGDSQEFTHETDKGIITVKREFYLDFDRSMSGSSWTYQYPDGSEKTSSGESRLYMPKEIFNMVKEAGFEDIAFFGDYHGNKIGLESPRCICVARKP